MYVEFEMRLVTETDRAYCFTEGVRKDNAIQVYWIPKTQIFNMEMKKKDQCYFEVPEWLALEKGLI